MYIIVVVGKHPLIIHEWPLKIESLDFVRNFRFMFISLEHNFSNPKNICENSLCIFGTIPKHELNEPTFEKKRKGIKTILNPCHTWSLCRFFSKKSPEPKKKQYPSIFFHLKLSGNTASTKRFVRKSLP